MIGYIYMAVLVEVNHNGVGGHGLHIMQELLLISIVRTLEVLYTSTKMESFNF